MTPDLTLDPDRLDNRGILKGVQCACGQWWPDFVTAPENAMRLRTECCGSLYQRMTGMGGFETLSLVEDNSTRDAGTPARNAQEGGYKA